MSLRINREKAVNNVNRQQRLRSEIHTLSESANVCLHVIERFEQMLCVIAL
jgi:hypothetical protein